MNIEDIYKDILELPEPVQDQVRDFVEYLKVKYRPEKTMNEGLFWRLIASIDQEKDNRKEMLAPLVDQLSGLTIEDIYAYQDILAEKLSILDAPKFWNVGGGSSDSFLYSRCYVVASGKEFYLRVLENPDLFPDKPWVEFEQLLYAHDEAYEKKTGEELTRVPATNYETMFNVANWGAEAIQL